MLRKTFWMGAVLLTSAGTLYAMGHSLKSNADDTQFDAQAEGAKSTTHLKEATNEQKAEGLPAQPADVEKDAGKGFSDPFFKKPDLEDEAPGKEK